MKLPSSIVLKSLLILLLLFNAAGAFYGGLSFIIDPSGAGLRIAPEQLNNAPFRDYFLPGILLLLFNGLLPLTAGLGLLFNWPRAPLPGLPFWKNRLWAWSLAFASGVGLMIWIAVQIAMVGYWKEVPIQAVYGVLGVVITALTLSSPVQRACRLDR